MRAVPALLLLSAFGLGLVAASPAGGGRRLAAAGSCIPSATNCTCTAEAGVEYVGGDLQASNGQLMTAQIGVNDCCLGCANLLNCTAWTVKEGLCYFKAASGWTAMPGNATSGTVVTKSTPPVVEPSPAPAMSPEPEASPGMSPAGVPAPMPAPAPGASPPPTIVLPGLLVPPPTVNPVASPPPAVVPLEPGCVNIGDNCTCWEEPNVEYQGGDITAQDGNLVTAVGVGLGDCCKGCATLPGCGAFTLKQNTCYFKNATGWTKVNATGVVSGWVIQGSPPPAGRRLRF
ncbi:hypothetical protein ABPG77_007124 [Micractinium sp. CCAP 211/92]